MSKDWNDIDELIVRRLSSELEPHELQSLNAWLEESNENALYFKQMQKIWHNAQNLHAFDTIDAELDYKKFSNKVGFQKYSINTVSRKLLAIRKIAAIFVPLVAITLVIALYQTTPGFGKLVAFSTSSEIKEGVLPDNSSVAINSESKLVFEKDFNDQERVVKLNGEAYFKVTKDSSRPFVVKVGDAQVEVLGTEFNIDENKRTGAVSLIVTEGQVLFSTDNNGIKLQAGQAAVCVNGVISRKANVSQNLMAWRTGEIDFSNASLTEVLDVVLDYFPEVKHIVNNGGESKTTMTSKFIRPSLEEVLIELRIHFNKKFTIDDNKLIISD